ESVFCGIINVCLEKGEFKMDITKWEDTWGTINWEKDPEDEIKQKITEFYHAGVDFNMESGFGSVPLQSAAAFSTVGVVDLLIGGGADINLTDGKGWTLLHCAAECKKAENIKYLIEHGPSNMVEFVNKQDRILGATALYFAASCDRLEIVKALIETGADVNIQDNRGCTALMVAAQEGYTEVVQTLIEAGADVDIKNNKGETASVLVRSKKIVELIKNADQIRAEYLKKHPQSSLQQTLNKASNKPNKMSLIKDKKTR
ncbi:MAG: ankyrin repeat domain-containing protein, partial [Alphaproteobacteria bacterium]|nr:ankyrin repeat domain-containing protein [Alphaproteobacteria bacterium]